MPEKPFSKFHRKIHIIWQKIGWLGISKTQEQCRKAEFWSHARKLLDDAVISRYVIFRSGNMKFSRMKQAVLMCNKRIQEIDY